MSLDVSNPGNPRLELQADVYRRLSEFVDSEKRAGAAKAAQEHNGELSEEDRLVRCGVAFVMAQPPSREDAAEARTTNLARCVNSGWGSLAHDKHFCDVALCALDRFGNDVDALLEFVFTPSAPSSAVVAEMPSNPQEAPHVTAQSDDPYWRWQPQRQVTCANHDLRDASAASPGGCAKCNGISLVEAFAGIGTMAQAFKSFGFRIHGSCESDALCTSILAAQDPQALHSPDYYGQDWRLWPV
jgi:hypothetical protein